MAAPSPIGINYSYNDVPTIAKFAASDAFIRGLMGPFRCLPGDTEFLTPTGWKRLDAYEPGDLVAQWHQSTNAITWVYPTAYVKEPGKEFIEFDSGMVTMQLSENHSVPHYNWDGRFQIRTAAQIEAKPSRRKIPVTFALPPTSGLDMSDELIRFAVMMHADGHYPKAAAKAVVSVHKERKKRRIRQTLRALGMEWVETGNENRPTETRFRFVPPYVGKRYDAKWWAASPHQLEVILDEAVYWDGTDGVGFGFSGFKFFTAHKMDADFIQYAAHATGRLATISVVEYPDNPEWSTMHNVHVMAADSYKATATIRAETSIIRIPSVDGLQYCFNVPTGFFVARCEGTIFITGNSGKSSGCVIEIMRRALCQRPAQDGIRHTRWVVVRNTTPQLSDTTIRTFHMWVPPQHFGRYYESDHTYVIKGMPGCDIEILFRALDRPEHIKNLLSLEVTGAWVNEAREVPWPIIETLQARVGQYPPKSMNGCTWGGLFMDTNPPDVDSKWYKFFEEEKHDPNFVQLFKQPSGLGPDAENLSNITSRDYYKNLATGKSAEWVKVYIHGEYGFIIDGKPVFPEFKDATHCKAVDPVSGVPVYRGWDWGLTPACVFSQILPDGRWLVFDEMNSENMGIDRFSDEVLEHSAASFARGAEFIDIGDPAGNSRAQTDERTIFDILQKKGIEVEPGEITVTLRLESVRKVLNSLVGGEPRFVIHPRCKMLRKGLLGGYQYRRLQVSAERYTAVPEKNKFCVPLHSEALTPRGWKKPEELCVGDAIYGYDLKSRRIVGTKVEAVNVFPGKAETVTISDNYSSFESTPSHRHVARTGRSGANVLVPTVNLSGGQRLISSASEDRPRKQRPFSDEFISLAAWVMAEGNYRLKDGAILLAQSEAHNPQYCRYLDDLLGNYRGVIRHSVRKYAGRRAMRTWRIMRETAWLLRHWMPDKIPSAEFMATMCNSNRRRFLYEFIRGDGHAGGALPDPGDLGRARDFRPHGITPRAFQKDPNAIAALQMMASLSGIRTVARKVNHGWTITFLTEREHFAVAKKDFRGTSANGVWCPTTGTGTWLCRQRGQVFITGNSHGADALAYTASKIFGGGLTMRQDEMEDFGSLGYRQDDRGRSSVTGY